MHRVVSLARLIFVLVLLATAARAEGFVDLRVGGSFTEDGDVELSAAGASIEFERSYEDSLTGGVRGGYWFDSLPWFGLAGDVSYFGPDDDQSGPEFDVIPISPLLMLRAPLAPSDEFPHGRVQPFAGIGPGIFVSLVDFGPGEEDEGVNVGLDVHAGLRFLITPNVAIFAQTGTRGSIRRRRSKAVPSTSTSRRNSPRTTPRAESAFTSRDAQRSRTRPAIGPSGSGSMAKRSV